MVLELVHVNIIPGKESEYEAALAEAWHVVRRAPGCTGFEARRCIERPSHYLLTITWETLEAHTTGFRNSPDFLIWRGIVQHLYDGPATVEHFKPVPLG